MISGSYQRFWERNKKPILPWAHATAHERKIQIFKNFQHYIHDSFHLFLQKNSGQPVSYRQSMLKIFRYIAKIRILSHNVSAIEGCSVPINGMPIFGRCWSLPRPSLPLPQRPILEPSSSESLDTV